MAVTLDKNKRGRTYFLKDASTMYSLFGVDTVKFPDWLTVFEMLSTVWKCISNPLLAEVSEKTVSGELQREFTQKIRVRLQNCGIAPLSKLNADFVLSLAAIVQEIN